MKLGPGEPAAGPWRVERRDSFARSLTGDLSSRTCMVAVDGHGGAGKSTLAERLRRAIPRAVVVHTDDVAWWHSRFGWADLMWEGVLGPLRAGADVRYQPPAWAPRVRGGHIEVPTEASTVIIEGVGASRRELTHLIDVAVRIQPDYELAEKRGIQRDIERDGETPASALRKWWEWADEEVPFLAVDQSARMRSKNSR